MVSVHVQPSTWEVPIVDSHGNLMYPCFNFFPFCLGLSSFKYL